jgi:N-acetylglucosamine-6-phosphate deacetylase
MRSFNQVLLAKTFPMDFTRFRGGVHAVWREPSAMRTLTGDIITPHGIWGGGRLIIDDAGQIGEISPSDSPVGQPRSGDIDVSGHWVLPGFIDVHVHGGGGADFMDGTPEAVQQVARTHARFGTTGLLATTLTASQSETDKAIRAAGQVMASERALDQARILGIHLEGPYICHARRGAQPEAYVRPPDLDEFAHWLQLSEGRVRQITLAPELPGAEALVRAARTQNVTVSLGHTDATVEQTQEAADWGVTQATHLFNAMPPIHHRHPGAAVGVLVQPQIVAEIIADGVHLHPLMLHLALAAKGPEGVILITDAISGAAMPDGEYALGGTPVRVQNGKASFADGTLAGSVLTMNRAFHNLLCFAGISPPAAALCASANAARQLGLTEELGTLEPGKHADLVVMEQKTGNVILTMIGGQIAYQR